MVFESDETKLKKIHNLSVPCHFFKALLHHFQRSFTFPLLLVLLSDSVKNKVATEHEYSLIHSQRSMKR
jgi:hypothetical protein